MKRIIVVLLFFILFSGCGSRNNLYQAEPGDNAKTTGAEAQEGRDYSNISSVEMRKFIYSGDKTIQSRKLEKLIILEQAGDIKKVMDIFECKVKNPGIVDRSESDYRIDIIKKDGSREVYDFDIGDDSISFFDNTGNYYSVRSSDSARAMIQIMESTSSGSISEEDAISMVIKDNPDFPANPSESITRKLPTGGPQGAAVNVKFTTKIDKVDGVTYAVTLTKDWGITVNGKYAMSFWKYKVTQNSVSLVESVDNDYLPNIMK